MPLIERVTRPKTAPTYRPTSETCYGVIDALFDQLNIVQVIHHGLPRVAATRELATRVLTVVYGAEPPRGRAGDVVSGVITGITNVAVPGQGIVFPDSGFVSVDIDQCAIAGADLWNRMGVGVLVQAMYPATAEAPTTSTAPSVDAAEQLELNASFAALMAYSPEPEELDESERRPTLRYKYPRR